MRALFSLRNFRYSADLVFSSVSNHSLFLRVRSKSCCRLCSRNLALADAELAACKFCSAVDSSRLSSMVFLCCVESSSANLSYAPDLDSSRARVSRLDASRDAMRDLRELASDSLDVDEDLSEAISDSRVDRVFSRHCKPVLRWIQPASGAESYPTRAVSSWFPRPRHGLFRPSSSAP
ncbi:hypothetical protein BDW42DRAFT_30245 [Aspergillus taichungensis]|uniref:Uncharacterized protein n=1 Tax=Aspergillus taichungensis TaxID=482145 RepID=A0A2J5I481_9EURO|nr:hypothetical protein BDW42DRAFT_30245 [Aspergillus taichungensis]